MGQPKYYELKIAKGIWKWPKRFFAVKNPRPHRPRDIRDYRGEGRMTAFASSLKATRRRGQRTIRSQA